MISRLIVSSLVGGSAIGLAEILRINKFISNETSRKILHIAHGLVVGSWAFITNYNFILGAEVLFLVVVLLARKFDILQPLRSVNRKSWGDIFFPLGVITCLVLAPDKLVFLAAILHLTLADALAALVGRKFKKGQYFVFGQRKTLAGSGIFFITSLLIIFWLVRFTHTGYQSPNASFTLLFIPLVATLVENCSPYGSDNFTLPLLVVLCLNAISF